MTTTETRRQEDFIRALVDEDIKTNRFGGQVVTRFPPEPNGYLHIGHTLNMQINFGMAADYGGRCHLRFDDTNPAAEEEEYVESIKEDVRWIGWDWGPNTSTSRRTTSTRCTISRYGSSGKGWPTSTTSAPSRSASTAAR